MLLSLPLRFNPDTTRLFNPDGTFTKDGRIFFLTILNRTGANSGTVPSISDPLTATGTVLADALALQNDWNDVETCAAGAGVAIPAAGPITSAQALFQPGNDIWVFNGGSNACKVWPQADVQIDALGVGVAFSLAPGKLRCFQLWSLTQIHSYGN